MSHYHHLNISEREKILILYTKGNSLRAIAMEIGRSVSTVAREIKRNSFTKEGYSAIEAQKKYHRRRKKCKRRKLLSDVIFKEVVMHVP
jgi:IS30 family transposase